MFEKMDPSEVRVRMYAVLEYAMDAHDGQVRKYSGENYIVHPNRVAAWMTVHPKTSLELVEAAVLHDVMEDCGVSKEAISAEFGEKVAEYVDWMTNKSKETGLPRHERKKLDRIRLAQAPDEVCIIKLFDRLDNLMDLRLNLPMAKVSFAKMYAYESIALVEKALYGADEYLSKKVLAEAHGLLDDIAYLKTICGVSDEEDNLL